tara:strand:- start:1139 stop:1435 length:297 start_codon:yes stop_codon:yes gene_type:complete
MLPYYKETIPCDFCGEHTHGRILEKDILCGSCKKVIINNWEKNVNDKEPERYHEWILWKSKKENYRDAMTEKGNKHEACADNTGTSRNRQDDNSVEDS